METYTLPYVKHIASRSLLCDTRSQTSSQPGGVGWEGVGRAVQEGENIYTPVTEVC